MTENDYYKFHVFWERKPSDVAIRDGDEGFFRRARATWRLRESGFRRVFVARKNLRREIDSTTSASRAEVFFPKGLKFVVTLLEMPGFGKVLAENQKD